MTKELKVENNTKKIHTLFIRYIIISAFLMFWVLVFMGGSQGKGVLFLLLLELFITAYAILSLRKMILLSNTAFDNRVVEKLKSEGGNLPLDMEKIDFKKLVEQTLADMEDAIEESGMDLRCTLEEKPLFIHADGSKLYRVIQNLVDNALNIH